MTKHARLCQNCLPKNIFFSFTRWQRSFGNKRRTGRDGDSHSSCGARSHVNRRDDYKRAKGSSSQKNSLWTGFLFGKKIANILCVCWNERSKMEQRKQGWFTVGNIYIFGKKCTNHSPFYFQRVQSLHSFPISWFLFQRYWGSRRRPHVSKTMVTSTSCPFMWFWFISFRFVYLSLY